jgi:hypothetical protein
MTAPATRTLSIWPTDTQAARSRNTCGHPEARVQYQAPGTTHERPWAIVVPATDRKARAS